MKIIRTNLHLYRNEQWFQFYTEFKKLVENYGVDVLEIDVLFDVFLRLYADADLALETISKSVDTAAMQEKDMQRENTFRGFFDALKAFANHFNAEKRQAAAKIQIIFDHYGNLNTRPNDEQTASFYNFLQDVRKNEQELMLLGLNEWADELERNNTDYQSFSESRNSEQAARTKLRMIEVRKETDACYRSIVERLEALMLINGDEKYAEFVNKLNNYIVHNNNILAQRKGISEANKEKTKSKN